MGHVGGAVMFRIGSFCFGESFCFLKFGLASVRPFFIIAYPNSCTVYGESWNSHSFVGEVHLNQLNSLEA
jgi:uncharacterized integral membrane protein